MSGVPGPLFHLSPRMRRIVGWTMIIAGIPLWILPLPLGLPLIVPGALLVAAGSPLARRRLVEIGRRFPDVWRRFRTFRKNRPAGRGPRGPERLS